MRIALRCFTVVVLLVLLSAGTCVPNLTPAQVRDVCAALIGPIKYTSLNKESQRYAAVLLAMDLKERNQVGQRLRCPQYR